MPFSEAQYLDDTTVLWKITQELNLNDPSNTLLGPVGPTRLPFPFLWIPRFVLTGTTEIPNHSTAFFVCSEFALQQYSEGRRLVSVFGDIFAPLETHTEERLVDGPHQSYYYTDDHGDVWELGCTEVWQLATIGDLPLASGARIGALPVFWRPRCIRIIFTENPEAGTVTVACSALNAYYNSEVGSSHTVLGHTFVISEIVGERKAAQLNDISSTFA